MTHERPNLKQIRIKKSVCAKLDERKARDDSYTDVIKALLDENEMLKARCEELQKDKDTLTQIAVHSIFKGIDEQYVETLGDTLLKEQRHNEAIEYAVQETIKKLESK